MFSCQRRLTQQRAHPKENYKGIQKVDNDAFDFTSREEKEPTHPYVHIFEDATEIPSW